MDIATLRSDGVPNLDGETDDAVREFARFLRFQCFVSDFMDALHVEGRSEAKALMASLASYCDRALAAREHRLAGRIAKALELERQNERTYQALPSYARW